MAGADVVEFDVRRSADGVLVVRHDPTIESANVCDLTLDELRAMQPNIPTLDDVLDLLRGRAALEVEIKNVPGESGYEPSGATIARDVVATLRRHAFAEAFVSSFDEECLRSVKEVDGGIATGLQVDADLEPALDIVAGRHAFLLPEVGALERAGRPFIDRAHERDVRICAWTVDDAAGFQRVFELGADAVETNDPALGVRVRDSLATRR